MREAGKAAIAAPLILLLAAVCFPVASFALGEVRHAAAPAASGSSLPLVSPAGDARVIGVFKMSALVTVADNVHGEHAGQKLTRTWTLSASSCAGSVCQTLILDRERSAGTDETHSLTRTGPGLYAGSFTFYAPLRCRGRVHPHGSRVPYRIKIAVAGAEAVEGFAFAREITATYVNPKRFDTTRCPLGPSHDAAIYTGSATALLPAPPSASFTYVPSSGNTFLFTDTSAPGTGGAPIISHSWDFGDPASGATDSSAEVEPTHQFSQPGLYTVTLTETDANGLIFTSSQQLQG
jgi:hypothetical protein